MVVATAQISDPVDFLLGQENPSVPKVNWSGLSRHQRLMVVQGLLDDVKKSGIWASLPGFKRVVIWATEMAKPNNILPWVVAATWVNFDHHCRYLMDLPTRYGGAGVSRVEIKQHLLIDRDGDLYRLEMKFGFKSIAGELERVPAEWTVYDVRDDLIDLVNALGLELIDAVDGALNAGVKHWQGRIDHCQGLRGKITRFYERVE